MYFSVRCVNDFFVLPILAIALITSIVYLTLSIPVIVHRPLDVHVTTSSAPPECLIYESALVTVHEYLKLFKKGSSNMPPDKLMERVKVIHASHTNYVNVTCVGAACDTERALTALREAHDVTCVLYMVFMEAIAESSQAAVDMWEREREKAL